MIIAAIQVKTIVPTSAQNAFLYFTRDFFKWWPQAYTFSKDTLKDIGIEDKCGGMCYEIGEHGFRCDWGRVLHWEPQHRLAFTWQINQHACPEPDATKCSEVSIIFEAYDHEKCSLLLIHKNFDKHGVGADRYREELAGEFGWPFILQQFAKYVQKYQE